MQNTHGIVALKAASTAKSRLASCCTPNERQKLFRDMASNVLDALRQTQGIEHITIVTPCTTTARWFKAPDVSLILEPRQSGTANAFAFAIEYLRQSTLEQPNRILMMAGDLPMADAQAIEQLLAHQQPVVIVPDTEFRGTNALLLDPGIDLPPCFGHESFQQHQRAANERNLNPGLAEIPALMFDVDKPADLKQWRPQALTSPPLLRAS